MYGKTRGIVIKELRYKDTSKILSIYTEKKGKISVLARGVYKPKSRFIANTQLFTLNDYYLYKGKSFYYINEADVLEPFYSIREDLDRLMSGSYLLELIDLSLGEEDPNPILFKFLLKALEVLSKLEKDFLKFIVAYEIKFISFIGYRPVLSSCANCKKTNIEGKLFSIDLGGLICSDCGELESNYYRPKSYNLDKSIVDDMKKLMMVELDKIEELRISEDNIFYIHRIMVKYILDKLDRESFKSLDMYRDIGVRGDEDGN